MLDTRLLECAIAFRMTTVNTGAACGNGCSRVACLPYPDDGLPGDALVALDADADADGVADAVSRYREANGSAPGAVTLGNEALLKRTEFPRADDSERGRRLTGTIAMVTGSAQGFGKGIAEALAREGAVVVIADLNEELGQQTTAEINTRYGEGTALFEPMNVTDRASIDAGMAACIGAFGGVDLFIANAGVLKAGGVDELDEASFDLVTNVNYKGYVLGTMSVARWMKHQHACNPDHFMDIVQINSKSGLEGSKRNFAYAGSKFGAIGLTQSFAMELVEHNIKVNSICPGNFFDGPLWSDPERGLFVQYLKAGKVPGAKTIDDVKDAYLAKVPMNRGCTPDDVATAILYAVEQTYETGQAIPVTGGQVMLS